MAPIMKKAGTVSTGKSGTSGPIGRSGLKVGSTPTSGPKLPSVASAAGKSYSSGSYVTPKNNKSSSSFSIIWLPGRKRNNKYKETVYNSHKNERPKDRVPSMYNIMSGDSSNHQTILKKKEEVSDLSLSEKSGNASVAIAGAGVVASAELPQDIVSASPEDKHELIKNDKEDSKEAAGDTKDIGNINNENLEHKSDERSPETKTEKGALEDNVDSVFLRSPPPHKTRSQASTVEEEDCGIKCLYYTLQCCDCVLM